MQSCPKCGKKHRKFPRSCYYEVHSENAHLVIANLASYGNPQQKQFAQQASINWERMDEYARVNFPNDIK